MAPGYRTATQTRRGARGGFPEHDDFEGLPVRQWRQEWVNVAPPPQREIIKHPDRWAIELPQGMPKDWQLLPPHSQDLLRAARSGALYKRRAPGEEEEGAETEAANGEKAEKKEEAAAPNGYLVKVWKQVPRNSEGPTVSHLAKRHKGTITLPSKADALQMSGPTITKATVRRIDAAGNPYTQEVVVQDGQKVDGEIISTTVVPAPHAATETATSPAPTPAKKRPPPPKRKGKLGRGRGRGRGHGRLPLPASTRPAPQEHVGLDGPTGIKDPAPRTDEAKVKHEESGTQAADTEMADRSVAEDEDGDEGDENDDDEGDEGEGTPETEDSPDHPDHEMRDAPPPAPAPAPHPLAQSSVPPPDEPPASSGADSGDAMDTQDASTSSTPLLPPNPLNLAPASLQLHTAARVEGSPLKNVILPSPTDPSPNLSPVATASQAAVPEASAKGAGGTTIGLSTTKSPTPVAPAPPAPPAGPAGPVQDAPTASSRPSDTPIVPSAESKPEETPGIVAITTAQPSGDAGSTAPAIPLDEPAIPPVAVEQAPEPQQPKGPSPADVPVPSREQPMPGQEPVPAPAPTTTKPTASATERAVPAVPSPATPAAGEQQDNDGYDILGSLEASLNTQAEASNLQRAATPPSSASATAERAKADAVVPAAAEATQDHSPPHSGEGHTEPGDPAPLA